MSDAMEVKAAVGLRRFLPYPKYRHSGVDWLGEIPAHWPLKRMRFAVKMNPAKCEVRSLDPETEVSFIPMEAVGEYGGLDLEQLKPLETVVTGYTYFRDGDVIVAKITPCFENGKGALARCLESGIAFGTTELHVLRPKAELKDRFLFYLTVSHAFRRIGASEMYGAGGQKRVPADFVRNFRHPIPNVDEQCAIAAFLDRETGKIDALMANKERLIELLQEKRTALITQAVTKGLDPNVPMKDSGVEWLGEIPAHWEVFTLKRVTKRIQTGSTPPSAEAHYYENGSVPWFGPGSFSEDLILSEPVKVINEEAVADGVARVFDGDSIMIVTIGATIGKVGYIDAPASSNQQITAVIPDHHRAFGKFLAYRLKSLEPVLRGIAPSTTLPIMDQQEVGYLPVAIPKTSEQAKIVEVIDRESKKVDVLIAKIRDGIDRLKEFRTALISAAVTGKIDVREEAPV